MTLTEEVCSTPEGSRLFTQEGAIVEVTELICKLMKEKNVTYSQLSKKMGIKKKKLRRLMAGEIDITIRQVGDILHFLDVSLMVSAKEVKNV